MTGWGHVHCLGTKNNYAQAVKIAGEAGRLSIALFSALRHGLRHAVPDRPLRTQPPCSLPRLPGNAFLSRHFLERRVDYRCRLPRATCHLRARTRYNAAQDPRYDFLNWLTHRRNFIYHAICPRPYRTTLFYRLRSTLGVAGDEVLFIDLAAFMTTAANTPRGFWANWHYWSCRLI